MTLILCTCLWVANADDPASKLVVGSVWRGTEKITPPPNSKAPPTSHGFEMTVTERNGDSFKATASQKGFSRNEIAGQVNGRKISWRKVRGRPGPYGEHSGTIDGAEIRVHNQQGPPRFAPKGDIVLKLVPGETIAKGNTKGKDSDKKASERKGDFPDLDSISHRVNVNDPIVVRKELARLVSSSYYVGTGGFRLPISERLAIPYRGQRMALLENSGYPNAEAVLLGRFDHLMTTPDSALKQDVRAAKELVANRLRLANANQIAGVTPDSSLLHFGRFLFNMQKEVGKLDDLLSRDQRDPEVRAETLLQAAKALKAVHFSSYKELLGTEENPFGGRNERLTPAVIGGRLQFADYFVVDDLVALWRDRLLPPLTASAGSSTLPGSFDADALWRLNPSTPAFRLFELLRIDYKGGQPLTNVVMRLVAKDGRGGRAEHYYFFPEWKPNGSYSFKLHPRWMDRKVSFTMKIDFEWSIWCDQGRLERGSKSVTSVRPNPDPESWRRNYEKNDAEYDPWGLAYRYLFLAAPLPQPKAMLP
jgi:hypothetical protein